MRGLFFCCCILVGCATPRVIRYDVGALPSAWKRIDMKGAQHALHREGGGTIYASSSCNQSDADAPLDVLTNHLLFEFSARKDRSREELVLGGRAALRTVVDATLDGVPVTLDLVVLKKDGCTIDLQLVSAPAVFEARRAEFDGFVRGFRTP